MIYDHLDKLVRLATDERYLERIREAKNHYFRATGTVYEEEDFYEARMNGFVEFYIFDYGEAARERDTLDLVLKDFADELSQGEVAAFLKFRHGVHSIFEFRKKKQDRLVLLNLWDGKTYEVSERRALPGINKKDLFDARLLPFEERLHFSNAFVFHPREARKFIAGELKAAQNRRGATARPVLHRLAQLRLKFDRYRGMDAQKVYSREAVDQLTGVER